MASETLPASAVLAEITAMLVEIVGDEYLLADEVTPATTFNEDLALESIEFVALAELLHQRYGDGVDLMGFLAEKDMEEVLAMSVGDLVEHIALSTSRTAPRSASLSTSLPAAG
ncbi:acyl carrier protein [Streptomyces antimicrobicus]|uniref:Acyl carrier protein n=1 Tax=Streptomyces antimicrobicus TaxID=2883108 RepID=A0ABS8BCZ2_9ACTN|nr:acyl carrier protein [Streptomyces antimicrobicus]MCB5182409.1 acyl carrier protein [Streptomyces antimicrobicus]